MPHAGRAPARMACTGRCLDVHISSVTQIDPKVDQFNLSTHKPINDTYSDAESGVAQYKVQTEIKMHDTTTTISRRINNDVLRREEDEGADAANSEWFGLLAYIYWHVVGSTVIRFGGQDIDAATFFRKENFSLYGWRVRIFIPADSIESGLITKDREHVFTAQDGKEYRWSHTLYTMKLKVNDASATLMAEYRVKSIWWMGLWHGLISLVLVGFLTCI
ncbi:hypothetical protein B0H10DRAFT_2324961 [Mycena sp. CBHHK59/15]|nr:hypothetical protein B0H10DRAFT_2324961 [Mycena sp. CBHHK59/15]